MEDRKELRKQAQLTQKPSLAALKRTSTFRTSEPADIGDKCHLQARSGKGVGAGEGANSTVLLRSLR